MNRLLLASLVASTALVTPAQAQEADVATLRAQIESLRAQLEQMTDRLDRMETEAVRTDSVLTEHQRALAALPATQPATPEADGVEISFNGAPEIEAPGGWSFKPFGRLNLDVGTVNLPDSLGRPEGYGSELRRARLGMEGDIPGGFGYKIEVDFAGNEVAVTDAYFTYGNGGLTLTAGQHNNYQSMEELTSSRWSTFLERAAFTDAFGFERRVGLGAQYASGDVIVQGGVFSDNTADLPGKNWSMDGRVVFAPKVGSTQLHLGGSLHYAELESGGTVRYRQRPLVHFTSQRPIATPALGAESERGMGLEAAMISGRFHAAGEAFWQTVNTPGAADDPTFFGGFLELGYYLTSGDKRGYRGGRWDRTRPANPVDEGGPGAWQINLRYDYLDLNDGAIVGGKQDGWLASLIWVPTDYTRLMLNYGHLEYDDSDFALGSGSRSWSADVLAMRGQIDF